jgi:hypothetical protein
MPASTVKILLALFLSLTVFRSIKAQETPEWVTNLQAVLSKQEHQWKITAKDFLSLPPGYFHGVIKLTAGANRSEISIDIHRTPEQAQEQFDGEKIAFTNILKKGSAKSSIEGLGDDNYMFIGNRNGYVNLFLIQGNVLIKLFAPSIATTKRLVRYIAACIPPSNKHLERTRE